MGARIRGVTAAATLLVGSLAGCTATETLLEATDPDLITPEFANSPEGALALYFGALARLRQATAGSGGEGSTWLFGGLLADEWSTSSTFVQNDETDQRAIREDNSTVTTMFRDLSRTRTSANQAIALMKQWRPAEVGRIAELYWARGFVEMQMASDFCNGIPLSNGADPSNVIYGVPQPVAAVFATAIASLDSGLAINTAADTASQRVHRALLITKARALLGINQVAAAAALIVDGTSATDTNRTRIPTAYTSNATYIAGTGDLTLWAQPLSARRYTVGDSLEGNARNLLVANAIPFFSARDPRVPVSYTVTNAGRDTTRSQDGLTFSRTTTLWARTTATPIVSGLDARLITAEGQLAAGNIAGWLATLNALRAAPPRLGEVVPAAMAPLTDPGTPEARVSLLFREKAFWQFGRGHRLGDLRRLVRFYPGRTPANTFPTGQHYRGGVYGADLNLPIPQAEQNNPNVGPNARACIDRNA